MSEYQYYEFQAIDRPLGEADREALRALSTRARITATSFVNSYQWGDFKGDPLKLMERWFDLHLYWANWGSRRLMIRIPKRLIDEASLDAFLLEVDCVTVKVVGENLILDVTRDDQDRDDEWHGEGEEGLGQLAALAPLRADLLAGDLRLLYLLWLIAVEDDIFEPNEPEPISGTGPLTGPLRAFAGFLGLDPDLVQAAAERSDAATAGVAPPGVVRRIVAALSDGRKTELLARLFEGDPGVAAEVRAEVRKRRVAESGAAPTAPRTVGELRARAQAIRLARERAAADKAAAERGRQAEEAGKARRARIEGTRRRGEKIWIDIEDDIGKRNAAGYDRAANLLFDLKAIAEQQGTMPDFIRRVRIIRERHGQKRNFIKLLEVLDEPAA